MVTEMNDSPALSVNELDTPTPFTTNTFNLFTERHLNDQNTKQVETSCQMSSFRKYFTMLKQI